MTNELAIINSLPAILLEDKSLLDSVGELPNIEMKVHPNLPLFRNVEVKNGYLIQQHILTGICRLVGPDQRRIGIGSAAVLKKKLKRISRSEFLKPGDIIGVSRFGLYEHFGIYVGGGTIIHYADKLKDLGKNISVHETDLEHFLKDAEHYFAVDFIKGVPVHIYNTTHRVIPNILELVQKVQPKEKYKTFNAEETIKRAYSRLGEHEYNVATNNCEHFAMWCKTGVAVSNQVEALEKYLFNNNINI